MSVAEFVSHLQTLDVWLSAKGERLHINAPKGVLTDGLRSQITERKRELLEFVSDHEQSAAFIPPSILWRTNSGPAPLSFAQERLWFLERLEPGSAVYNICRASRLTGQLNIAALESSLSEIVRVLLIYQYRYPEVILSSGLTFAPFDLQFSKPEESVGLSSFDLILRVTATSTEFTGTVNYRTLSGVEAHRIVQVFRKTLRLMISDPNEILSVAIMQV